MVVCLASLHHNQLLPVSLTRCPPPRPSSGLPRITLEVSNQERGTKELGPQRPLTQHQTGHHIFRCKINSSRAKRHVCTLLRLQVALRRREKHRYGNRDPQQEGLILPALPVGGIAHDHFPQKHIVISLGRCTFCKYIAIWPVGKKFVIKSDCRYLLSVTSVPLRALAPRPMLVGGLGARNGPYRTITIF